MNCTFTDMSQTAWSSGKWILYPQENLQNLWTEQQPSCHTALGCKRLSMLSKAQVNQIEKATFFSSKLSIPVSDVAMDFLHREAPDKFGRAEWLLRALFWYGCQEIRRTGKFFSSASQGDGNQLRQSSLVWKKLDTNPCKASNFAIHPQKCHSLKTQCVPQIIQYLY